MSKQKTPETPVKEPVVTRTIQTSYNFKLMRQDENGNLVAVKDVVLNDKRVSDKLTKQIAVENDIAPELAHLVFISTNEEKYEMPLSTFIQHATLVKQ